MITRSNFSNSFKRPQFVKLCTIIKSVTFYIIAFQHMLIFNATVDGYK